MKFVHIADMHFDKPFTVLESKGLTEQRRLEQRNAFNKMIDYISMVNFINERKTLCNLITYANKIITAVIFVSYPVFLAFLFYYKNDNLLK